VATALVSVSIDLRGGGMLPNKALQRTFEQLVSIDRGTILASTT
jgi:hypothetical protein